MFTDQALITINITCITFLVIMLIVMAAATRMKGGAGGAALIVVTTTVPIYLANLTRDLASDYYMLFLYPSIFLNAICFPATWFLVRSLYDKSFRFTGRHLLHAIPAIISLVSYIIYYASLSAEQIETERVFIESGNENLPAVINDIIMFGQFFIYFVAMFFYVCKRNKYLQNNYSDSDYLETRWIPGFLWMFFILYLIVVIIYIISPRTDTWLIPILNTIGMAYLAYNIIFHSTRMYINRLPDTSTDKDNLSPLPTMDVFEMKKVCERITDYLISSQAYRRSDLSLAMLSKETGVSQKVLSKSINGYLSLPSVRVRTNMKR